MQMLKENKGITIITLVVTIIILLILAGVGIYSGGDSLKVAKSNSLQAQLDLVQHSILERYAKYELTQKNNIIVGTPIEYTEAQGVASKIGITLKSTANYYRLEPTDLEQLGILDEEDTYIVNYQTGEALNETQLKTILGEALYTSVTN